MSPTALSRPAASGPITTVAARRLVAQGLVGAPLPTGGPLPTAADAVRHLVAVQSQDYAGAKWALGQRVEGATEADIDRRFDAGEIIRTHVLRPTWHFVAPEDLRWLLALSAPRLQRGDAHRWRTLEIDADLAKRAVLVFERAIGREGPLTRRELRRALAEAGIDAAGGRLAHLVMHAELEAVICSGPRKGAAHTYALVDERIPAARARTRDDALAEIAGRYVTGHGPAQDVDLAWWSGLGLTEARQGLESAWPSLDREVVGRRTFWIAPSSGRPVGTPVAAVPSIHLLPNYDELLVAFRDRSDALHPALPAPARAAEEILGHVIVRDGLVIGRWRLAVRAGAVKVTLEPHVLLNPGDQRRLLAAVERYAAFLGRPVEVTGLD